ncbi:BTAD domain-containing putative transcriptional regulator [Nocardiopsis sp. MG754419]|uniref:AfsR/SARP family transcriptional regulator n=1 Tax=Nocardiopsis sp. MG754419 TaxID=2259865 RepID=UPI001BAE2C73|nr:BTAD domain-containing putative transcriptional regulator [Nocardiopsis sp. MG754419]MBR8744446.1 SARP family transcriptional regulator [Nocardiopsis sp. MG754419]
MSRFGPVGPHDESSDHGPSGAGGLHVGLLGRFTLQVDGAPVRLRGERRRALLAALMVATGRPVSTDVLIARVWDAPGPSARGALQVQVARIRALLEEHLGDPLIRSVDGGYRVDLDVHDCDLLRLRALVHEADRAAEDGATDTHADLLGRALTLWRGPVLADVASPTLHRHDVPPIEAELLRVAERSLVADLARGEHERVADRAGPLVAAHPRREPLVLARMVALYRCGRQSEALRAYSLTRSALAEDPGVAPGRELRAAFHGVLRDDLENRLDRERSVGPADIHTAATPAPTFVPRVSPVPRPRTHDDTPAGSVRNGPDEASVVVPAELPAAPSPLVGRAEARAELDRLVDPCSPTPGSVLVRGPAGAGASALVTCWGHAVASHFPDGQLYVNLRGADGVPRAPAEVLRRLVRSLSAGRIDTDDLESTDDALDEAAARLRSLMAGRRVLLVLDNAATARQVRPLLPGDPGSAAVVTSRNRLTDLLVRDGLRALPLDALSMEDAVALLRALVGERRHSEEALERVAALAGGLPLSLRMAVAWLDTHPTHSAEALVRLVEQVDPAREVSPTARMTAVLRAGSPGTGTVAGKYRPGSEHPS